MALITVLLLMGVLFMMVLALFLTVRGRLNAAQLQADSVAALYVAEAGVAEALDRLEANPSWPGVTDRRLGRGSYSIRFHQGGPHDVQESVNNLLSAVGADSHRGQDSVRPYSALLVVEARVGLSSRTVEALVTRQSNGEARPAALQATGAIHMEGSIAVDGVKSLDDPTPVRAGIHSSRPGGGDDVIVWQPGPGDSALITGEVSTVSPSADAIRMPGASIAEGAHTGANALDFPAFDIPAAISAKASCPAPSISNSGVTVLSDGEYYVSGDLQVGGGDLILQNARLYVDGNLQINGALKGTGSVYVSQDTQLRGDTDMSARHTGQLALLSQGDVELLGFNGSQYLQAIADSEPDFQIVLDQVSGTVRDMQALMRVNANSVDNILVTGANSHALQSMRRTLGQGNGTPYNGYGLNLMRIIHNRLETRPLDSQRDFLVRRFDNLDRMFSGRLATGEGTSDMTRRDADTVLDFNRPVRQFWGGWMDAIHDSGAAAEMRQVMVMMQQLDYNRLGSSVFQGLVYTRGSFRAAQEVDVVGGILVDGDARNGPRTVSGRTLQPGDVLLEHGCRILGVEDILRSQTPMGSGDLRVRAWLGR